MLSQQSHPQILNPKELTGEAEMPSWKEKILAAWAKMPLAFDAVMLSDTNKSLSLNRRMTEAFEKEVMTEGTAHMPGRTQQTARNGEGDNSQYGTKESEDMIVLGDYAPSWQQQQKPPSQGSGLLKTLATVAGISLGAGIPGVGLGYLGLEALKEFNRRPVMETTAKPAATVTLPAPRPGKADMRLGLEGGKEVTN